MDTRPIPMAQPVDPNQGGSNWGDALGQIVGAYANQNMGRQDAAGYEQSDWSPVQTAPNPNDWQQNSNQQMMLARMLRNYG